MSNGSNEECPWKKMLLRRRFLKSGSGKSRIAVCSKQANIDVTIAPFLL